MTVSRAILKTRYPVPGTSRYLLVPHDYRYPITGIARTLFLNIHYTCDCKSVNEKLLQLQQNINQSTKKVSQLTSHLWRLLSLVHNCWETIPWFPSMFPPTNRHQPPVSPWLYHLSENISVNTVQLCIITHKSAWILYNMTIYMALYRSKSLQGCL